MKYLSVCSGIEAATVAWHNLGWSPVGFSEIEPFPSAVLAHHYPEVKNLGDMTKYEKWNIKKPGLLVGGTPCQSFSVAGLRRGLHDPRGGLMLTFLEIARRYRVKWVVWENVPGVLSSDGGRDFGAFLGALGWLGYGWAYRVLDAQWFGVAQRRRRVFVVGCLGDPTAAAKVLFESESVYRDSEPSREAGERVAPDVSTGAPFSRTVNERVECDAMVPVVTARLVAFGEYVDDGTASTGKARAFKDATYHVVHGTQDPIVSNKAFPIGRNAGQENVVVYSGLQVRRLTPVECERLQGFPDNYTLIPWSSLKAYANKKQSGMSFEEWLIKTRGHGLREPTTQDCPDGPRYKALGNSMAVPVMRWIGERIEKKQKEGL